MTDLLFSVSAPRGDCHTAVPLRSSPSCSFSVMNVCEDCAPALLLLNGPLKSCHQPFKMSSRNIKRKASMPTNASMNSVASTIFWEIIKGLVYWRHWFLSCVEMRQRIQGTSTSTFAKADIVKELSRKMNTTHTKAQVKIASMMIAQERH